MERIIRLCLLAGAFLLTIFLVNAAINAKVDYYNSKNKGIVYSESTVAETERQLKCLAINIYKEAGYEPFEGKVGVAQVTLNRVTSKQFPNDVCKVVYQKNKVMQRVVCQFSWYCDSVHRNRSMDAEAYQESYEVAKKVLLEDFKLDSLKDALYYHADYVNPNWKKTKVAKFGVHIFYKDKV